MTVPMSAFHAYDIRGIWNVDFDRETAYKVGYFVPALLDTDRVLVGMDCRESSPQIHEALIQGICDAGADVYDLGLSSTPMVYFGTARLGFKASVQITASHNPKEYNGMKVSRENALPVGLDSGLGQIKEWIEQGRPTPPAEKRGRVVPADIRKDYLDFLRGYLADLSGIKVAFDLSNGMACILAKEIFGENHSYIFDDLDGSFPNHEPNPLIHKNVEPLEALVLEKGADVGVIYDGDADRVMFVDNEGHFIAPDLVIGLLGRYFIGERKEKGVVLQDIRSSKSVGEYLEPLGMKVETWKVGRAFAADRLRAINGVWGGELAGHYYFRDFFYSDSGMLASLLVLRVVASLKAERVTLADFVRKISHYRNSGEINFRIEDKQGAMDALKEMFTSEQAPTAVMDFDGYRVEFPDWWFNVRPSNTEPYLRFICEATSEELLKEKVGKTRKLFVEKFNAN